MSAIKIFNILLVLTFFSYFTLGNHTYFQKRKKLSNYSLSSLSYRGPVDRSINLKFKVTNIPNSKASEIYVFIEAPQNFIGNLNYNWTLGSDLFLTSGSTSGLVDVADEKNISLKIQVNNFNSSDLKHIRFEISGHHFNRRIFSDGIISNQINNSFEQIVTEVEKFKKENN